MGTTGMKRGSGESHETEAEETVTAAIRSPPPSSGVTPVVMWIKWQKTDHARSLVARLPRPGRRWRRRACVWHAIVLFSAFQFR